MGWVLIVILVVAVIFFVWQLALFIRDLIKHIKKKKADKDVTSAQNTEKKGE